MAWLSDVVPMALAVALLARVGAGGAEAAGSSAIRLNQIGFYPAARKIAVVVDDTAASFEVVSEAGEVVRLSGTLGAPERWPFSEEIVRVADFSALRLPGRYRVVVKGLGASHPFRIGPAVYRALAAAILKSYYFLRSGADLDPAHAGRWAREGGHPDDRVTVHESAESSERPAGTVIASPGGWYDAGDYNKYIVSAGIATYTLLSALEHYPDYFRSLELGIPESGNALPDILDEALWSLRWMLTMQDSADGGVYHKVTTLDFAPFVMPRFAQEGRYVVQKTTAAALDFAATTAMASRVLARWSELDNLAGACREAAESAWGWAERHPAEGYVQPADVKTGTYAPLHESFADEWAWAGVELYLTTGEQRYLEALDLEALPGGVPSWDWVAPLAWISLAHAESPQAGLGRSLARDRILGTADRLRNQAETSAYRVAMGAYPERFLEGAGEKDFSWGSNGVAGNQAFILMTAFYLTGDTRYRDAALSNLDYLLGRNATGYCFVTGQGTISPQAPHHRLSQADAIAEPVPGLVVGGPHDGMEDALACEGLYRSSQPARAYVDHVCSYATNEIAINWNAAWVYALGAIEQSEEQEKARKEQ